MTEKSQGISKLKLAEKEANEIIEKARKERIKRSKEAEAKAKTDIEKFRQELDVEFENFKAKSGGSSEETFRKLRQQTDQSIHELQVNAKKNKDQIVSKLLSYIVEVNVDPHPNVVVAQKLGILK
eukprot:EC719389.1.p1 GENE.EC719389.1~~EC719389.1.p1  ORF type:complete len:134 (+),score=40.75 EC719389.1:28-402(+)